jgi:hypothetical protein
MLYIKIVCLTFLEWKMIHAKDQFQSEFKVFVLFVEGSQHLNNGIKRKALIRCGA